MTDVSATPVASMAADAAVPFTRIGVARTLAVNRPEIAAVVAHLGLPSPSALSPLPALAGPGARGLPRDIAEIVTPLAGLADDVARWAFTPLAIPDRILEARAAVFNGAPTPCRLYATRSQPGVFAGVRPALAYDYELLAPFSDDDLEAWVRLGLQLSGGQQFPLPAEEMSGAQLAFLLAVADAHKTAMARAFLVRSSEPPVLRLSVGDVLDAQQAALSVRDRRWAVCAVGEVLSALIHPGGGTGVGLPVLDEAFCRAEVARLATDGFLVDVSGDGFRLGPTLSMFASTLVGWLTIVSLHDVQIVGVENGRPQAQEEMVLYVATDATIWTLVSDGLARAGADLSGVRFVLRSMDVVSACRVAHEMLQPAGGALPESVYVPVAPVAAAVAAAPVVAAARVVAAAPPPPPPPPQPAVWAPTHIVPATGLDAWKEPDATAAPVAKLDATLPVQVTEQLGAWAHVVCSNGWAAWVDGRLLEERAQ
jgi:hypothetical protein